MGLLHTWRGSVDFLGVLWPEALLPFCMGGIPRILVWLGPQDTLQLHLYKKGELISPGCWAGLTCHHGHRDQLCLWTGTGGHQWATAGLWGAAAPGCQGHSWALHRCVAATGQLAAELQESFINPPGYRPQLGSEKRKSEAGKKVRKGRACQRLVCLHSLFARPPLKPTRSSTQDTYGNRENLLHI